MKYRALGKTGLTVSEIGFGGEWLERHSLEECVALGKRCRELGINIVDCWMSDPEVRTKLGEALKGHREDGIIQGHIGSTWQGGQYVRTRSLPEVKEAFKDLQTRLGTEYIDLGMIHYVDQLSDWEAIQTNGFVDYVKELKAAGTIGHIGLSTHNPVIGKLAAECGYVEVILFSSNPAFDLLPASEDINNYFVDEYDAELGGIDPVRSEFYKLCEQKGVALTVMKGFAGGRLFDAKRSPFGVAMTPVQCLHYCLTRPAVAAVMVGYDTPDQVDDCCRYETASEAEKDYATLLAKAPRHAFTGQCTYCNHCKPCPSDIDIAMVNKFYDLATMQPEVPASVREHYKALPVNASSCIGCRDCESRCPFGVPIAERMEKAAKLFG
ncbi:MAG: aldo/keto reductase [Firmicutes bacterium]|nr:aldo/keto reductase [Bacillota bacterium]